MNEYNKLNNPSEPICMDCICEINECFNDENSARIRMPKINMPQMQRISNIDMKKLMNMAVENSEVMVDDNNLPQITNCEKNRLMGNMRNMRTMDMLDEIEVVEEIDEVIDSSPCGYCITPAMSYTPMQSWGKTYEPQDGFKRGTIFPDLDLPFIGSMEVGK